MLAIVLFSTSLTAGEPETPFLELPKDMRKTIDQLLTISNRKGKLVSSVAALKRSAKEHEKFLQLLTALSRQVSKELLQRVRRSKALRVKKNLILMAHDFAQHPERYKEILDTYSKPVNPRAVVERPPRLKQKHTRETYRLVWELLLLAPINKATWFMESNGQSRIFEAIGGIHSDQSIPVIVQAYEATVRKGVSQSGPVLDRQRYLLSALNHMHNKSALTAIIECLSLSDKAAKGGELPKSNGFTVRQTTFRLLTFQGKFGYAAQWQKVLKDFPTKDLPEKDRKMLTEALCKIDAAKKKQPKP